MKKLCTIVAMCLAFCWAPAQINVSTGINTSGGALPVGSVDPGWKIVSSPYPPGVYPAYVVPSYLPYWQVTPITGTNARWLNKATTISTELPGIYTFERSFSVPASTSNFSYNLSVAYDDAFVSLELVSPSAAVTTLAVTTPATAYHLNTPSTGTIITPLAGAWRIRARVHYIDQLGAFMLSGNVNMAVDSSVYCCSGTNLVRNGNFEMGNAFFASQYAFNASTAANGVIPGQYNVVNRAQALNISPYWNVEDHTKCINGTNSRFMVVNGRTTQPIGTTKIIWQQGVAVKSGKEYKLCVNLKNMPQPTFDVKPQVRLEINGVFSPWTTINTAASMCSWQLLYQCFTPNGNFAIVRIHLREDGVGDGNDLAIDDIALQEKLSQNLSITVQHQGNPQIVTASVNTLSTADDQLLNGACPLNNRYYWFVFETTCIYPSVFNCMAGNTFAWSSNIGGWNTQTNSAVGPWSLTTTFPGYTFANNKFYVVGLYVPSCCESCYTDGFTYQVTGNVSRQAVNGPNPEMTDAQKEQIKAMFIKGQTTGRGLTVDNSVSLFPNPTNNEINVKANKEITMLQVVSMNGSIQLEEKGSALQKLDVSRLASGVYQVKILFRNGESAIEKFTKE
jgi:hypothetical protein